MKIMVAYVKFAWNSKYPRLLFVCCLWNCSIAIENSDKFSRHLHVTWLYNGSSDGKKKGFRLRSNFPSVFFFFFFLFKVYSPSVGTANKTSWHGIVWNDMVKAFLWCRYSMCGWTKERVVLEVKSNLHVYTWLETFTFTLMLWEK